MQVGERVLLPRVRQAERETLIISDGFGCRGHISQGTRRRARHVAEVLQLALRQLVSIPRKVMSRPGMYTKKQPARWKRVCGGRFAAGGRLADGSEDGYWRRKRE